MSASERNRSVRGCAAHGGRYRLSSMSAVIRMETALCGPDERANGGAVAGRIAQALKLRSVNLALRQAVPLDRDLKIYASNQQDTWCLVDGDQLLGEIKNQALAPWSQALDPTKLIIPDCKAWLAPARHPTPHCYVCGTADRDLPGLAVHVSRLQTTDQTPVDACGCTWYPPDCARHDGALSLEAIAGALDCPGAYALPRSELTEVGQIYVARFQLELPKLKLCESSYRVFAWPLRRWARRGIAATAMFNMQGEMLARASALWFASEGNLESGEQLAPAPMTDTVPASA